MQEIEATEASRLIDSGAALIDVREDDEFEAGHAPTAVHIPLGQLPTRFAEVPADGDVIFVCRVGGRSGSAMQFAGEQGRDTYNLDGGMLAWNAAGLPVVKNDGSEGSVI